MKSKDQLRKEANERSSERKQRTPEQQMERLLDQPGFAMREIARIQPQLKEEKST